MSLRLPASAVCLLTALASTGCERRQSPKAIAWGEAANGLQAGIAATGDAPRETPGAVVRLYLRNTGDRPARILRLGAARAYWAPLPLVVR